MGKKEPTEIDMEKPIRREIRKLRVRTRTMRETLEQIATSHRGGRNKRLAAACLEFIDHCLEPKRGK